MVTASMIDIREVVLSNQSFGPSDIERITRAVEDDLTQLALLKDAVQELQQSQGLSPATQVRLGVCLFLLGKFSEAEGALRHGDGGALAQYYYERSVSKPNSSNAHWTISKQPRRRDTPLNGASSRVLRFFGI